MRPKIAIIDHNTLAMIGLKQLLLNVMPIMQVDIYNTFEELNANHPETYFHYFVAMDIAVQNRDFFMDRRQKTMVLTTSNDPNSQMNGMRSLCTNVPEDELVRNLIALEKAGHPHDEHMPAMPQALKKKILSDREIQVLSLVAQGKINKEIGDILNISLTTVITHRKNIQEKLGLKSVSALTIYAVMHGYVDINQI